MTRYLNPTTHVATVHATTNARGGYGARKPTTPLHSIGRCVNRHGSKRAVLVRGKCRLCREAGL